MIAEATNISPFMAILWCFYPVAFLVGLELFLRTDDDDDDDPEGGVMSPVGVYQGASVSYTHLTLPTKA